MKRFKLKIGIDVDDILFSCDQYAIDLANKEYHYNPPLSIDELKQWGLSGERIDVIFDYFKEETFFENQPLIEGAKEFINKITSMAEVFFITAVAPEFMSIRAKRLIEEFPEVPKENIIMGYRKDMVQVDVLLDDGAHNVLSSNSAYPVLMRKPWNRDMTGCLAVNTYDEFITLIESIKQTYADATINPGNKVIGLVGPSASGKTELIKMLEANHKANRNVSYTTRKMRDGELDGLDYHFITRDDFDAIKDTFFETTCYAGEMYGASQTDIENALEVNNVVTALDICGAIALKKAFPHNSMLVFINRPKKALIQSILERNVSNEEKTNRIISLSDEYKNESLCDATVHNNGSMESAYQELLSIIND